MKPPKKQKISPAMIAMLKNASTGMPLTSGLHGRSEHGAAEGTRIALVHRAMLDRDGITAAGHGVLSEYSVREKDQ